MTPRMDLTARKCTRYRRRRQVASDRPQHQHRNTLQAPKPRSVCVSNSTRDTPCRQPGFHGLWSSNQQFSARHSRALSAYQLQMHRPTNAMTTHQHPHSELAWYAVRESDRLNVTGFRRLYPLQSQRFHALLNSLFKVLCNFPSRYLFAIGLVAVFSLR